MGMLSTESEPKINHFSHQKHPLHLTNYNPQQTLSPASCSGCKVPLTQGLTYTCKICNYYLHIKCSQMPQQIKHPFDPYHVFKLLAVPPYSGGSFNCDACKKDGNGFSYHCKERGTDLHILCASMPLSSTHHPHRCNLNLIFSSPYANKGFVCDVCKEIGGDHWLYRCDLCKFDAHLSCSANVAVQAPAVQVNQYQYQQTPAVPVVLQPPQMPVQAQQILAANRAAAMPQPFGRTSSYPRQRNNFLSGLMGSKNRPNFAQPNQGMAGGYFPGAPQPNQAPMPGNYAYAPQANQGIPSGFVGSPHANQAMPGPFAYAPAPDPRQQQQQQQRQQQHMLQQGPMAPVDGNAAVNDAMAQLLQQLISNSAGGGDDPNAQLTQALMGAGGGANAMLLQIILNHYANGGGGGNGQLFQGGGGGFDTSTLAGGGGLDVSSLTSGGGGLDLSSLLGGVDIGSVIGMMGGLG